MSERGRDERTGDEELLGQAMRDELHALVADLNPSADLVARVEALASDSASLWGRALQRVRRRRILISVPIPLAALAATLVAVLGGGSAPVTARGLTILPNGAIRLSVDEEMDVAGTNAELRHYGFRNIIIVPFTASCPRNPDLQYLDEKLYPAPQITEPKAIRPGYIRIIGARIIGKNLVQEGFGQFKQGHAPNCLSTNPSDVVGGPPGG
jgi:hypothetical protein